MPPDVIGPGKVQNCNFWAHPRLCRGPGYPLQQKTTHPRDWFCAPRKTNNKKTGRFFVRSGFLFRSYPLRFAQAAMLQFRAIIKQHNHLRHTISAP
jgi:hypothetical protein